MKIPPNIERADATAGPQRAAPGTANANSPAVLRQRLAVNADQYGDKVFVHSIDQNKAMSYRQLHEYTLRIAAFLGERGVRPNERIALLSNNSIEHLAVYLGVMAYGATVCTVHVEMNIHNFEQILSGLGARLVFFESALPLEHLDNATPSECIPLGEWDRPNGTGLFAELASLSVDGSDVIATDADRSQDACIYFTSGTSATPKGVVLTFGERFDNAAPTAEGFAISAADTILDYRSFNWVSAQILSGLVPVWTGATVVMARKFSLSRFFGWVRNYTVTVAAGNPTVINLLMKTEEPVSPAGLQTLRYIISSSAPLSVSELERFEARFGIPIAPGFGTSETGWVATSNERIRRVGSAGRPLDYHNVTVVDAQGQARAACEVGYVELGNDSSRRYRYLAVDGSVYEAARGRIRTGDLGFLAVDGYLFLTGREKDLIIRGGANIAPAEVDGVLTLCPKVAEAGTIGIPDPIYGEEVASYVVLEAGQHISEADLIAHCRADLPQFKTPKHIIFEQSLPKTERGKLDRKALSERWRKRQYPKP